MKARWRASIGPYTAVDCRRTGRAAAAWHRAEPATCDCSCPRPNRGV